MTIQQLRDKLHEFEATHPWVAGLIRTAEATAVGGLTDLAINGMDFSKDGLKHALTIVSATVLVAIRNYLKTSPLDKKRPEGGTQ